jgi:hypothetical protein
VKRQVVVKKHVRAVSTFTGGEFVLSKLLEDQSAAMSSSTSSPTLATNQPSTVATTTNPSTVISSSSSDSSTTSSSSPSLHGGSGIPGGVSVLKVEESLATLARRGRAVRGVSKEASQSLHGLLISLASCAPQSLHCQQLVRLTNALEEQDPGAVKSMLLFFCLANRFIC